MPETSPEGTGVAVAVGRPFENLATFIEEGLPGTDGQTVQRSINQAVAKRAYDGVSATTTSVATYPVCGAFGGELALSAPAGMSCRVEIREGACCRVTAWMGYSCCTAQARLAYSRTRRISDARSIGLLA